MLEALEYLRSLPCVPFKTAATVRFEYAKQTGIYAICVSGTNTSDSKIYIGSAMQDFCRRMILHRWSLRKGNHHSKGLQSVFNAYGFDCLYFRLVEQVDRIDGEDKEDFRGRILAREQFWIDAVPTEIRLNGSPTAGSNAGLKMCPEVREGHSLRVRLALAKPETKAKHSKSTKQMWLDPDYRSRIVAARVLMWRCPKYRAKISEARKQFYANNPEAIEAKRVAGLKLWENSELRDLMTKKNKENCNRPEVKALISRSSKDRWANTEWAESQRKLLRKTFETKEYRQKLKEGQERFKNTDEYQEHIKARAIRTKTRECTSNPPRIIISPDFEVYVTDSLSQFSKDIVGDSGGSGLTACAAGKCVTHKGWRVYTLDNWFEVPEYARHCLCVEHKDLPEYVPFTQTQKQNFVLEETKLREKLKQEAHSRYLKNKWIDLGSKSNPCIFIAPNGTKYVTDLPTQFAVTQGFEGRSQRDRFTVLANGKCSSFLDWTGYKLTSWTDVPNDAIRVLWGEHPDLPEQKPISQPCTPIQLSLDF